MIVDREDKLDSFPALEEDLIVTPKHQKSKRRSRGYAFEYRNF